MTHRPAKSAVVLRACRPLVGLLSLTGGAQAAPLFDDVSAETGMTGFTETWGGSWGDINNDNWPDIINQGHREYPRIFRNTGEGAFEDIATQVDPGNWMANPYDDKHGASLADFDNDGDDDLMISVSRTGPAQFLVNTDGKGDFVDRALDAGLAEDERARLGVWFDYNDDGLLDVAQVHESNGFLRRRNPTDPGNPDVAFVNDAAMAQFLCDGKLNYAQLVDINTDWSLDVLCLQEGIFPVAAYDVSTYPFTAITNLLPELSNINDTVVADFDNDQRTDMIVTRGSMRPSGAVLKNSRRIEAWVRKSEEGAPKGFDFRTNGSITVTIDHAGMGLYETSKVFNLAPGGQTFASVSAEVGGGPSLTVQYIASQQVWRVRAIETNVAFQAYLQIDAAQSISNLTDVNLDVPELAINTVHLRNTPGGLVEVTDSGLDEPVFCISAVAGDFDNDMDQDLYLVCRRGPANLPNRYYENQGDGTFVERFAHGAEGPVGAGFEFGVGDSVVTADYDVDGFLDLYVTNGLLFYPFKEGGPEKLFRNRGNTNHWIELDLEGVLSNRDGIGAIVYVTAGGVTQMREQNGGYHRWSQNDRRLHVGLGPNTTASIAVVWPSGQLDTWNNVAADRLYVAKENGPIEPAVLGPPVYTEFEPGDECGEPAYSFDYGPAVLLWKNCSTGVWSLRAKGGRFTERQMRTVGRIAGNAPFAELTGAALASDDSLTVLDITAFGFDVGTWFSNSRGFDFRTGAQTLTCIDFDRRDIPDLIVGQSGKKLAGGLNLITMETCAVPPPPGPSSVSCGEPDFDAANEHALFAWRDCAWPTGAFARWNFRLTGGGRPWSGYSGQIDSDVSLNATGVSLEANDLLDTQPGDSVIDFDLFVAADGVDGFQADIPAGSITCLDTDALPAGTDLLVGDARVRMTGDFDLLGGDACAGGCHP